MKKDRQTILTLDDAIIHAKEESDKLGSCPCGDEHRMLLGWLLELKKLKKYGYKDFAKKEFRTFIFAGVKKDGGFVDIFSTSDFDEKTTDKVIKMVQKTDMKTHLLNLSCSDKGEDNV